MNRILSSHRLSRRIAVAGLVLAALVAAPALAQDISITQLSLSGSAEAGNCNTVVVKIRNNSSQLINVITGVQVITFPSNTPFQNRATKNVFFSALQPNQEQTRTVTGVQLLGGAGTQHTIQAVADFQNGVTETNESNNTSTQFVTPSQPCGGGECDLKAESMGPFQSTLPGTYPANVSVKFRNVGSVQCSAKTVVFYRDGSPIGTKTLQPINPNYTKSVGISDTAHPQSGSVTYSYQFNPQNPDSNPSNDLLTKTVTFKGPAPTGGGRGGNDPGCDLYAQFSQPTGSSLSGGSQVTWQVYFKNQGKAGCSAAKVRLNRLSSSCSGYGSFVGGSGAIQFVNALQPGQSQTVSFRERPTPRRGSYCYKVTYTSPFNDSNNGNHHPTKKVSFN